MGCSMLQNPRVRIPWVEEGLLKKSAEFPAEHKQHLSDFLCSGSPSVGFEAPPQGSQACDSSWVATGPNRLLGAIRGFLWGVQG